MPGYFFWRPKEDLGTPSGGRRSARVFHSAVEGLLRAAAIESPNLWFPKRAPNTAPMFSGGLALQIVGFRSFATPNQTRTHPRPGLNWAPRRSLKIAMQRFEFCVFGVSFWSQFWVRFLVPIFGTALTNFLLAVPKMGTKKWTQNWDREFTFWAHQKSKNAQQKLVSGQCLTVPCERAVSCNGQAKAPATLRKVTPSKKIGAVFGACFGNRKLSASIQPPQYCDRKRLAEETIGAGLAFLCLWHSGHHSG